LIDRRHVVLGVALAASVATSYGLPPTLFYGEETLSAPPVTIDDTRPIRAWVVTTRVTLPAEATRHPFTSTTEVWASTSVHGFPDDGVDDLAVVMSECGHDAVADGPALGGSVSIKDAFVDCVPEQPCFRTLCVAIGTAGDGPVAVEWETSTIVESFATVDYDVNSITVPIDIDIDEILP